jgi:hypothetical protein
VRDIKLDFGEDDKEKNYYAKDFLLTIVKAITKGSWSTNGREIVFKYYETGHFDAQTGKIIHYSPNTTIKTLHYDYLSNNFWNFSQDSIIGEFKKGSITNFTSKDGA